MSPGSYQIYFPVLYLNILFVKVFHIFCMVQSQIIYFGGKLLWMGYFPYFLLNQICQWYETYKCLQVDFVPFNVMLLKVLVKFKSFFIESVESHTIKKNQVIGE